MTTFGVDVTKQLSDVVSQVQAYIKTVEGIKDAPSEPPESIAVFPYSITYPIRGKWLPYPAKSKTGLHSIRIDLHTTRRDGLPRAYKAIVDYCEVIPDLLIQKFYDDRWNHSIQTFESIDYDFVEMEWGKIQTLGYRFSISGIKMQSPLGTHA